MHDAIKMSYIGLLNQEIKVLMSIFTLAPQLSDNYVLVNPDKILEAEIILVNADNPKAIEYWKKVKQRNNIASSLMLSSKGDTGLGDITLHRPIRIQKLISALEDAIEERTIIRNPDPASRSIFRILVVDDSYPVRKYMDQKLTELIKLPLQLSFAASGEEAIFRANKKPYDLIFLDVMMEGVDGYRTCKTIKAEHSVYVVLLTSKKSPFDKVRGTMSGCDGYVTKPPSDQKLLAEVQNCLRRLENRPGNLGASKSFATS